MQEELKSLADCAKITILAQGDVFTLAKASVLKSRTDKEGSYLLTRPGESQMVDVEFTEISAEGMARRSHLDKQDVNLGQEIAAGRALKALAKKINGNGKAIIRHRFMG